MVLAHHKIRMENHPHSAVQDYLFDAGLYRELSPASRGLIPHLQQEGASYWGYKGVAYGWNICDATWLNIIVTTDTSQTSTHRKERTGTSTNAMERSLEYTYSLDGYVLKVIGIYIGRAVIITTNRRWKETRRGERAMEGNWKTEVALMRSIKLELEHNGRRRLIMGIRGYNGVGK